jgi:hypothetical protein
MEQCRPKHLANIVQPEHVVLMVKSEEGRIWSAARPSLFTTHHILNIGQIVAEHQSILDHHREEGKIDPAEEGIAHPVEDSDHPVMTK